MKILVNGAMGRMGRALCALIERGENGAELAGRVDAFAAGGEVLAALSDFRGSADCLVDFSNHAAAPALTAYALAHKLPLLVASTGHTEEETALIRGAAAQIPVFFSGNLSLGVAVLVKITRADIEIVETHHNQKLDVPSGTALMLGRAVQEARPGAELVIGRHGYGKREAREVGIHSLRLGTTVGVHEVLIHTGSQVLSLKHEACDRTLFAEGALAAAAFLIRQGPGLYSMDDLMAAL